MHILKLFLIFKLFMFGEHYRLINIFTFDISILFWDFMLLLCKEHSKKDEIAILVQV